jgi:plasmid stabilization system protein ParE
MVSVKTLELHPLALEESEAAAAWYAARDPRVAARFVADLEANFERVLEAPRRWPLHLHGMRRVPLTRFPYVIWYRDESSRVLVVAVAHGRRKPGYWKER